MNEQQSRALACAVYFRGLGLAPLPSRSDKKRPMLAEFAQYHAGVPVPESVYDAANWRARNLQIITGAKTGHAVKLAVVDLDGAEARPAWKRICASKGYDPATPWVCETGSGGMHIYYTLPAGVAECPSGMIWGLWDTFGDGGKAGWAKHKEIRILGDGSLVVAPPSIHVDTGTPYRFVDGFGPRQIRIPETMPTWLLEMPRLSGPVPAQPPRVESPRMAPVAPSGTRYTRDQVLAAIRDKVALAKSWGLVFDRERPNPNGWCSCYVPGREEPGRSTPSGSFNANDGVLQDRKDLTVVPLFDLGAMLQPAAFPTWLDCKDWCGDRYLGDRRPARAIEDKRPAYGGFGKPA